MFYQGCYILEGTSIIPYYPDNFSYNIINPNVSIYRRKYLYQPDPTMIDLFKDNIFKSKNYLAIISLMIMVYPECRSCDILKFLYENNNYKIFKMVLTAAPYLLNTFVIDKLCSVRIPYYHYYSNNVTFNRCKFYSLLSEKNFDIYRIMQLLPSDYYELCIVKQRVKFCDVIVEEIQNRIYNMLCKRKHLINKSLIHYFDEINNETDIDKKNILKKNLVKIL